MHKLLTVPVQLRSRYTLAKPVSWLELFFDLVFVAAVAQVGSPLAHDFSFAGLGRYAFLFFLIWMAWLGHTMFNTRFISDDPLQRLLTLVQVFAIAIMAANARDALSSRDAAGFGAAYAFMRIVLVMQYMRVRRLPDARRLATFHASGFGLAAVCWLTAAFADIPARFWLWAIALAIDFATPLLAVRFLHRLPPDPAHLPERFGLFTIILMGESVMATMRGIESQAGWSFQAASTAFFGLSLTFSLWSWYFDCSGSTRDRHIRSPRDSMEFQAWCVLHFVFYLGIAVTAIGIEHAIALGEGQRVGTAAGNLLLSAGVSVILSMWLIGVFSGSRIRFDQAMAALGSICFVLAFRQPLVNTPPNLLIGILLGFCAIQAYIARENLRTARSPGDPPRTLELAEE